MATPLTPTQLITVLRAEGLHVVEYKGWRDRCRCHTGSHEAGGPKVRAWGPFNGILTHITGGNLGTRTVSEYIRDIINGDPETPTKSQLIVAPNGDVWINSAGRCNHAGKVGGTVQAHLIAADFALTDDYDSRFRGGSVDGNTFTLGIENIAAVTMTAAQRESSVRINAAIARFCGWTGQESVGHGEVSSARTSADPHLHMGNFRRDVMTRVKAGAGTGGTVTPPPVPATPAQPVWGLPNTWVLGGTSADVLRLGQRLNVWLKAFGLPTWEPDSTFSTTEVKALSSIQVAWGFGSEPADLARGGDSDGYPGAMTFARLEQDPPTTPVTIPGQLVETISANIAGYDKVRGMATRVRRAQTTIPAYFMPKRPTWLHFQECAIDMWPELDKKLVGYTRVGAGGKGRESYYRDDAGIKILGARLLNVEHMLLKDTKEHLCIAAEYAGGFRELVVNFHNENEGSTYQSVQLRDVMTHAREMADEFDIPRANILVTGDANFKGAAAFARLQGWTESIYSAVKKIDLQYRSTNGWSYSLVLDRRIDVDVFQRSAEVLEAEQLYGALTGDHWAHRVLRRLIKVV